MIDMLLWLLKNYALVAFGFGLGFFCGTLLVINIGRVSIEHKL